MYKCNCILKPNTHHGDGTSHGKVDPWCLPSEMSGKSIAWAKTIQKVCVLTLVYLFVFSIQAGTSTRSISKDDSASPSVLGISASDELALCNESFSKKWSIPWNYVYASCTHCKLYALMQVQFDDQC